MTGFTLHNTLRALPVRVITHNMGNIDSVANVVFLAGEERFAAPQSTFMFHGVSWTFGAGAEINGFKAKELVASIQADEDRIASLIAERTDLAAASVRKFFREAATKDADYAKSVGIVHNIAIPAIPPNATVRTFTG